MGKRIKNVIALLIMVTLVIMNTACSGSTMQEQQEQQSYIGILSAMPNEVELLLDAVETERVDTIGGVDYYVGTLCGKPVVIAEAGTGKALSAAGTAAMLNNYNISKVIFTGIAGGVGDDLKVLDEVVATGLVQHDYGTITNDGFVWSGGETDGSDEEVHGDKGYFYCDEALVDAAYDAAVKVLGKDHVFKGVIATGDQFVASEEYVEKLQKDFNAIACEMEGASVAAVCNEYQTPFVVIRAMSDKADGNAHETIDNMGDLAADNSSNIVIQMLKEMND